MTRVDHRFGETNIIRNAPTAKKCSDPLPQLLSQLTARMGEGASIYRTTSRPWASALFEGRRHLVEMRVRGKDLDDRVKSFADRLEDAEWSLMGHFVADICLDASVPDEPDSVRIQLSALTIEDW